MPVASCYRFVRCQVHPAFADVRGWFLEVRANDFELLAALHRSLTSKYHLIFGEDSHGGGVEDNGAAMAAIWLRSLEMELQEGDVLVNPAGGFVAKRDLIILAEIESDELTWPEQFADEIITISRWPKGKHYHLCSNRERVFVPEKFNTYQAAEDAARKYVSADRIKARP